MQKKQKRRVWERLQGTKQTEENKAIEKVSGWEEWEGRAELFINAEPQLAGRSQGQLKGRLRIFMF